MSHEADELDTKIGLLIQNRISLQVIYNIYRNQIKLYNSKNIFCYSGCRRS